MPIGSGNGIVGRGTQWMSWIHVDDMVGIFQLAVKTRQPSGPINGTAPHPVTNAEFAERFPSAPEAAHSLADLLAIRAARRISQARARRSGGGHRDRSAGAARQGAGSGIFVQVSRTLRGLKPCSLRSQPATPSAAQPGEGRSASLRLRSCLGLIRDDICGRLRSADSPDGAALRCSMPSVLGVGSVPDLRC